MTAASVGRDREQRDQWVLGFPTPCAKARRAVGPPPPVLALVPPEPLLNTRQGQVLELLRRRVQPCIQEETPQEAA